MYRTRAVVAFILVAAGLVWIGQGTGILRGSSFMVGDRTWAWIGLAFVAAGVALGVLQLRARTRSKPG